MRSQSVIQRADAAIHRGPVHAVCVRVGVLAIARRGRRRRGGGGVDAREEAVDERGLLLECGLELGDALGEVGGRRR